MNTTTTDPQAATLEECPECFYPSFLRLHGRGCPQGGPSPIGLPDGPPTPCDTIKGLLEDWPNVERRHWDTWMGWGKEKHRAGRKAYRKLVAWCGYPERDPDAELDLHYMDGFPYDYEEIAGRLAALSLPDAVALAGMTPVEIEARLNLPSQPGGALSAEHQEAAKRGEKTLADFAFDMATFVDDGKPIPFLIERSDGGGVIYDEGVIWLSGEPGAGKSYLQAYIVGMRLQMGRRAAWCDWEGSPKTLYRRLKAIGINPADFPGQLLFVERGFERDKDIMGELCDWLTGGAEGPASVHIESVTASGADPNGANLLDWWERLVVPFKGLALIVLSDHVPKRKEGRAPGPIGSDFKRQQADQLIDLRKANPWNATTDGFAVLINAKDRHGQLPAVEGEPVARMMFANLPGGMADIGFVSPEDGDNVTSAEMRQAVMQVLSGLKEQLAGQIEGYAALLKLAPGNRNRQADVIKHMKETGLLTQSSKGSGKTRYWASEQGQDYLDAYAD